MKPETLNIYSKYSYFLFVLSNERNDIFYKSYTEIDYEKFFTLYNEVIAWHWEIKPLWKKYNQNRFQIIKKFEYGKYEISIRHYFCRDIKNVILSFLFA